MRYSKKELTGITVNKHWKAFNGYTLYMPLSDTVARLIDMQGNIVHEWNLPNTPALCVELLPSGNLLYSGFVNNGPLSDLEGAGGILLEVDWDSKVVWEYKDPYLHHDFKRLPNGNTMIIKWVKIPEGIAKNVEGGLIGTERDGLIWADVLQEINPDGEIVWEWVTFEELDPKNDYICNLCPRNEWTQICSIDVSSTNDMVLLSMRKMHSVYLISKQNKKIIWRWGQKELSHQSNTSFIENGNILIFDGGMHGKGVRFHFSRVIEVDPKTDIIVWNYRDTNCGDFYFYSNIMSSCQRLPNNNTLICESISGRIFEITPIGEIVWEFIHPEIKSDPFYGNNRIIPSAYRYPPDYKGLPGQPSDIIQRKQDINRKFKSSVLTNEENKSKVCSRLENLGY